MLTDELCIISMLAVMGMSKSIVLLSFSRRHIVAGSLSDTDADNVNAAAYTEMAAVSINNTFYSKCLLLCRREDELCMTI